MTDCERSFPGYARREVAHNFCFSFDSIPAGDFSIGSWFSKKRRCFAEELTELSATIRPELGVDRFCEFFVHCSRALLLTVAHRC